MMKSKFLLLFSLFSVLIFGQIDPKVESIHLAKSKVELFQGKDSATVSWFLFIDENKTCYLANLTLPQEEIYPWFLKRKDSDNIFKSEQIIENGTVIYMSKKNEPESVLEFEVVREKDKIYLISTLQNLNYEFIKINIQE